MTERTLDPALLAPQRRLIAPIGRVLAAAALSTTSCASPGAAVPRTETHQSAASSLPARSIVVDGKNYQRLSAARIREVIVGQALSAVDENSPHSTMHVFWPDNIYSFATGRNEVDGTYRILADAVRITERGRSYDLYIYEASDRRILTGSFQDDGRITFTKREVKPIIH